METEEDSLAGGGAVDAASPGLAVCHRLSVQSTRPDYFQNLRRGSVPNLRLEGHDDTIHHDSPSDDPPAPPVDTAVFVDEILRRISLKCLDESANPRQVEVRLKDYSYHVPIRVDAPSINTALNTSPCYVATNIVKNFGELITGKRKVREIRDVWIYKRSNDLNCIVFNSSCCVVCT